MLAESASTPTVTVIVVSYNTRELTLQCLSTLWVELDTVSAEVFVVDNGSTDGSALAIRERFAGVTLIELGDNAGFGAANNAAFARGQGDYFLLLNSDAFIQRGTISCLIQYLTAHPRTAVVGPKLLNADGSLQPSCYKLPSPGRAWCEHTLLTAAFPNHTLFGDYRAWSHDNEREVEFVIGACMLIRRAAISEVGAFDERFFLYSEETDLCRRFKQAGWAIAFTPDAEVIHLNGGSGKQQSSKVFNEFQRASESYIRKHHGRLGIASHRAAVIIGSLIRISVFSVLAMIPSRRSRSLNLARKWKTILSWTLGLRGAGLAPAARQQQTYG